MSQLLSVTKTIKGHERKIIEKIYKIHDLAKKKMDILEKSSCHIIYEQIEEDITVDIVDSFELAGDHIAARLIIDGRPSSK